VFLSVKEIPNMDFYVLPESNSFPVTGTVFLWKRWGRMMLTRKQSSEKGAGEELSEDVVASSEEEERTGEKRPASLDWSEEGNSSFPCVLCCPLLLLLPPAGSSFVIGLQVTQTHCLNDSHFPGYVTEEVAEHCTCTHALVRLTQ
jgi:hypothetical protein